MSFACSSPAGGMLFGVSGLLLLLLLLPHLPSSVKADNAFEFTPHLALEGMCHQDRVAYMAAAYGQGGCSTWSGRLSWEHGELQTTASTLARPGMADADAPTARHRWDQQQPGTAQVGPTAAWHGGWDQQQPGMAGGTNSSLAWWVGPTVAWHGGWDQQPGLFQEES